MKSRSINIFLLDGDPNGIRVAQIMMSTIQATAFRRNKLGEVRKMLPESERPGGYSFSSASATATTVIGSSANDRMLWKLPDSRTYGDWKSGLDASGDQGSEFRTADTEQHP